MSTRFIYKVYIKLRTGKVSELIDALNKIKDSHMDSYVGVRTGWTSSHEIVMRKLSFIYLSDFKIPSEDGATEEQLVFIRHEHEEE